VPIAIGTNKIIPGPGIGLGGCPGMSSTVENTKGDSVTAIVTMVRTDQTRTAFLESDMEERGKVCISRKNKTDRGTAKNITRRTSQLEICGL